MAFYKNLLFQNLLHVFDLFQDPLIGFIDVLIEIILDASLALGEFGFVHLAEFVNLFGHGDLQLFDILFQNVFDLQSFFL